MRSREAVQQDDGDDVQQALWAPVDHLLALRWNIDLLARVYKIESSKDGYYSHIATKNRRAGERVRQEGP